MNSLLCIGIALIFISAVQAQSGGFCRFDTDCSPGYRCTNNFCQDGNSDFCRSDRDCRFGERCINRRCRAETDSCRSDRDCRFGERCINRRCRDCRYTGCPNDLQCQYDFFSRRYECVRPVSDCRQTGCPGNLVCRYRFPRYQCVQENIGISCTTDRDCPFGYCWRRRCVPYFRGVAGSADPSPDTQATGTESANGM